MKKTVAIISGRLEGGGAERAASNLSICLSEKYNVILIVFSGENITYPYKGTLVDLHEPRKYGKVEKVFLSFNRVHELKKIKRKYKVDCSISLLPAPNVFNCMTRVNDKIITSYRNYMSAARNSRFDKMLTKYVDKHSDRIVSLSKMTEVDLVKAFGVDPNNIMTIYNACDPDLIMNLAKKEKYKVPTYDYIVTTGRLMKQKGQWHLIKAFSEVHKRIPDLHLVILGEGELESGLKKITTGLGLQDYVHFMGFVKSPHRYMYSAKAFIFPSLYEGLGNVLLEALACGLPVVSTDCLAGPREILSATFSQNSYDTRISSIEMADYGILIPPFSMDDFDERNLTIEKEEMILAQAICTVIEDKELQKKYRMAAKRRIADFAPEKINAQWIKLIENLTGEE